MESDFDEIYDEDYPFEIELYNDLEAYTLASGSNATLGADGSVLLVSQSLECFVAAALGLIAGILIIGLKGVFT